MIRYNLCRVPACPRVHRCTYVSLRAIRYLLVSYLLAMLVAKGVMESGTGKLTVSTLRYVDECALFRVFYKYITGRCRPYRTECLVTPHRFQDLPKNKRLKLKFRKRNTGINCRKYVCSFAFTLADIFSCLRTFFS